MEVKVIHDKDEVRSLLDKRNIYDYMYQVNDLDDEEWSNVVCYGIYENKELKEIAMVYMGYGIPVLIAASFENYASSIELISKIKSYLPSKFYTHIDKQTLDKVFVNDEITDYHEYVNMGITDFSKIEELDRKIAEAVRYEDLEKVEKLFSESYPDAWIDEELLKLNDNYGVYLNENLISFAGVHAYSLSSKLATIAHVTTHPNHRSKGYGRDSIIALINDLRTKMDYIGLNVKVDNKPARKCYQNLGFKDYGRFIACEIKQKEE